MKQSVCVENRRVAGAIPPVRRQQALAFCEVVFEAGYVTTLSRYQQSLSVSDSGAAAIDTRCICLARLYGRGLGDRLRAERMELFFRALSVTCGDARHPTEGGPSVRSARCCARLVRRL